jgi:3-phenylpropionate/cinnamic acid dioxygenase small subunit
MAITTTPYRTTDLAGLLLVRQIEEFLYHECELLDQRRFREWLDLFADDARYWMPMQRNVKVGQQDRELTGEQKEIAWFDEGKETLTQRVRQIESGVHWAEEPLSRVSHVVTNVEIQEASESQVRVTSRFIVYRNRLQAETDLFVGKREDLLRKVDGEWRIAHRTIILDQNVLLAKNLTIFF